MPPPRGILFDLDDTLIDRDRSIARFASLFGEAFSTMLGDITPDDLGRTIWQADGFGYRTREEVISDLLSELPWRETPAAAELQAYWNESFPSASVGTELLHEVLGELRERGFRLGIITNGAVARQNAKIDLLDLRQYLTTVVISEGVDLKKPDPRIFQLALSRLDLESNQAWFVGDHPVNDVLGAASAGLTSVWFRRNHPWPAGHEAPALTITSLGELLPILGGGPAVR